MKRLLSGLLFGIFLHSLPAQTNISVINQLDLAKIPAKTISKYWLHLSSDGIGQPIHVPVLVAKGTTEGPVLGLVAAMHGNELNGIPIIQNIFSELDAANLTGVLIGIPGLNVVGINLEQREFIDGDDLNRLFPGKENGNDSQQYVWQITTKILPLFDYLIDMHTASFGRTNSFYVRSDMDNDTLAMLTSLQPADIILTSDGAPSAGQAGGGRTLRAQAMAAGIPAITIEYGNPQVYQTDMIEKGTTGIWNAMSALQMIEREIQQPERPAALCKKSYWIYTDAGGLLDVPVELAQQVKKGEVIGVLKNPFGDVLQTYYAPEDGIVIGKSSNPVNRPGGRIIHLGILEGN